MRLIGILPLLALLLIVSCATKTQPIFTIPNFSQVDNGIYRGGQPDEEGFKYLKAIGIVRVVKLNTEKEGSDRYAISNGMQVIYLPISFVRQTIGKPDPMTLQAAVAEMREGTYVHCDLGQKRTSLIIAAYRVDVQGWSKERAWKEMKEHGFNPLLRGLDWSFWEDIPFN